MGTGWHPPHAVPRHAKKTGVGHVSGVPRGVFVRMKHSLLAQTRGKAEEGRDESSRRGSASVPSGAPPKSGSKMRNPASKISPGVGIVDLIISSPFTYQVRGLNHRSPPPYQSTGGARAARGTGISNRRRGWGRAYCAGWLSSLLWARESIMQHRAPCGQAWGHRARGRRRGHASNPCHVPTS